MTTGRDLLVAAPERWDEACFAVPAVRALVAADMGIGVLCRVQQQAFWHSVAGVEVLAMPEKTTTKAVAAALGKDWQAALLWEAGWAADAVKLARVARRVGPAGGKLTRRLTHPLDWVESPLDHRVRFYLAAVEALGILTGNPEFFAAAEFGVQAPAHSVLLCPDSDFGASHEWPLDRWLELAKQLLHDEHQLTVAGLAGGRSLGQSLANSLGAQAGYFQATPLAAALPVLAAQRLVVAADGSLPHLAAHAGATCVTLFGPNDPQWKRPLGRRHAVVRRHVECAPCLRAKCPLDLRCQGELEPGRVWAALSVQPRGGS